MPVGPSAPRFIEVPLLATVCVIVRHQRVRDMVNNRDNDNETSL